MDINDLHLKLNDGMDHHRCREMITGNCSDSSTDSAYRPPIPGVRHSGGPPFRGSGLELGLRLGLTLADLRNGGPPEWWTGILTVMMN